MAQKTMLAAAAGAINGYYKNADEAVDIIIASAVTAAATGAAGSIIPGIAAVTTVISCFGTVWVMYGCICKKLGIAIGENFLKIVARAVLANIATNIAGMLAVSFIGNFVPGFSIFTATVITFMSVYLAGYIFLRLIANMAKKAPDPHDFTGFDPDEVKEEAARVEVPKSVIDEAKKGYRSSKQDSEDK